MHVDHVHEIQRMLAVRILKSAQRIDHVRRHAGIARAGDHRVGVGPLHSFRAEPHHLVVLVHRRRPTAPRRRGAGVQIGLVPQLVVLDQIQAGTLVRSQEHAVRVLLAAVTRRQLETELAVPGRILGRERQAASIRPPWPAPCWPRPGSGTCTSARPARPRGTSEDVIHVDVPGSDIAGERVLVRLRRDERPLAVLEIARNRHPARAACGARSACAAFKPMRDSSAISSGCSRRLANT